MSQVRQNGTWEVFLEEVLGVGSEDMDLVDFLNLTQGWDRTNFCRTGMAS
jgi:hypothetical protein